MTNASRRLVIDHIGIVVNSIEEAIAEWEAIFGYRQSSDVVTNTRQKVKVVFLSKEDSLPVKLLSPSEPSSPVALLARRGGGLHHVCFRCDSLRVEVPWLQEQGARMTVAPEPGEAFCNHEVAFFSAGNNLRFELIDTTEKRSRSEGSSLA